MFWKKYTTADNNNNGDDGDHSSNEHDDHGSIGSDDMPPPLNYSREDEDESVLSYLNDTTIHDDDDDGNEVSNILDDSKSNPSDEEGNHRDNEEDDDDDDASWAESTTNAARAKRSKCCCCCSPACGRLISSFLFVAGAALYIYSSYYAYDYYLKHAEIPTEDTVEQQVLFQANANSTTSNVTDFMAFTFGAALAFLLFSLWNLCFASTTSCLSKLLSYGIFAIGAIWNMASSALLLKDEQLSQLFQLVSVHLYLLAALAILGSSKGPMSSNNTKHLYCCTPKGWLRLADFVLVLGTIGDTALAYMNLWKASIVENGPITQEYLLYAGMATAGCWGLCAVLYFVVSLFDLVCGCSRGRGDNEPEENYDQDEDLESAAYVYEDNADADDDGDDDEESQEPRNQYVSNKYLAPPLQKEKTQDTANDDDDASVTSFSSWWTAGPANKDGIARSSLDKIFGR